MERDDEDSRAQGVQWPPIVLDTSWLTIGHVDEIVNFVPARSSVGYKVLLPSPLAACSVLDALLARSLGDVSVFAGTRDETTVAKLRDGAAASEENVGIDATIAKTCIDAWRAYHMSAGQVHCGTNTFRRLKNGARWSEVHRR